MAIVLCRARLFSIWSTSVSYVHRLRLDRLLYLDDTSTATPLAAALLDTEAKDKGGMRKRDKSYWAEEVEAWIVEQGERWNEQCETPRRAGSTAGLTFVYTLRA